MNRTGTTSFSVIDTFLGFEIVATNDLTSRSIARVGAMAKDDEDRRVAFRITHLLSLYGLTDSPVPDDPSELGGAA